LTFVLGLYLVALTLLIFLVIRFDAIAGRCQLFSTRNFFLLGLVLFQASSGAVTFFLDETERGAELESFVMPGLGFCAVLTVFTLLFLTFYRRAGWIERLAASRTRIRVTSKGRLVFAGVTLTALGIVLRFAGESIPYVAVLLPQIAAGCLGGGVALIAMAWARSSWNIFIAGVLLLATVASSAVLLVGAFGRREILGLLFSLVWALYQEKWRLMPVTRFIPRAAIAGALLGSAVFVFSASRVGGENVDRSLGQQVQRIMTIDPRAFEEIAIASLSGQFAGGISMWILNARLEHGGYYPLHSLVYFVTHPIPRDFWLSKPEGLGLTAVREASVTGVQDIFSWGPGLVGHLSHDIVFISLPLYALLIGWALRYMDVRTMLSTRDPVTVALFGSALGQILGMPRGDLGLFAFNMVSAFVGVWLFGRLIATAVLPIDREAEQQALEGESDEEAFAEDEEAIEEQPELLTDARGRG